MITEHDMTTAEGQLAAARERGLKVVTIASTGQQGWLVQRKAYGSHLRVRIAGVSGAKAVVRLKANEIKF